MNCKVMFTIQRSILQLLAKFVKSQAFIIGIALNFSVPAAVTDTIAKS